MLILLFDDWVLDDGKSYLSRDGGLVIDDVYCGRLERSN